MVRPIAKLIIFDVFCHVFVLAQHYWSNGECIYLFQNDLLSRYLGVFYVCLIP